jgi:predicted Zn-dependent protease with MMP-like domain
MQSQSPFATPPRPVVDFIRRANPRQAATIAIILGILGVWALFDLHQLGLTSHTLILLAVLVPIELAVSLLISAKLVGDAEAVHDRVMADDTQQSAGWRFADDDAAGYSEEEFARIADQELDALPAWIQAKIQDANVAIGIEDEREGQPHVLGIYQRSSGQSQITLYRLPIMRAAGGPNRLRRQIHDTLLHELGHLFGMSEADLDRYSIGNNPLPNATPVRPPGAE